MSWKRILNTARRNGIPLIVTDPEGHEPMVVMTLEQFEAMSSTPVPPDFDPSPSLSDREMEDLGHLVEEGGIPTEPMADFEPQDVADVGSSSSPQNRSMEEQFFLEPLEDEKTS